MKVKFYQIPKKTLEKLGLEKGADVVQLSMASTDLSFLLKAFSAFIHPMPEMKNKMKEAQNVKFQILVRANLEIALIVTSLIIGKTKEVWEMLTNRTNFQKYYLPNLDEKDKEIYKFLKKYFNDNMEWLKLIRDKEFHYDKDFKSHFDNEEKGCEFPDLNIWSNMEYSGGGGTTIYSDIRQIIAFEEYERGPKKEGIFDLHKNISEFLPDLLRLLNQLILYIVDEEPMTYREIEISGLEAGDTIFTNYFWELPFLQDQPVDESGEK